MSDPRSNPFPGLRPFREDEEHLFFGRENQIDAMVDKLSETGFLAVVGTSGSGKSSLVNCGLRPALRRGLMARAGTAWRMVQFRPGNDPIGNMARALAEHGVLFRQEPPAGLSLAEIIETTLRMSRLGLIDIFEQAALPDGVKLLVVVDQFEELFRYRQLGSAGPGGASGVSEDAIAFVNLLLEVKESATDSIFVVLTMRSDFLGDCTQFPGLAEAINVGQYLVPRLTRDERRAAIEGPVRVRGGEIAPVLLTRLVNDVGDNPDQLSILQHALNRTWALWQDRGGEGPLQLADYEAVGTMAHALDQHAEQAYAELTDPRLQKIAEQVFKALTDKATDPRGIRRPTKVGTLCELAEATEAEITDTIAVFRNPDRSFLMPPAGETLEAETVIDISHESLMRGWQRLIKWSDEEAEGARFYRRLAETADLYVAGDANLWRDPELQRALDWREKTQPNEAWASRYHPGFAGAMDFLITSSEARDAERAERHRQRQRELDAEREKAEAQARYARRMLVFAIVMFVAAAAVGVFALVARQASLRAEANEAKVQGYLEQAQRSQSSVLIEKARALEQDPDTRNVGTQMLLALAALPDAKENIRRPLVPAVLANLAIWTNDLRELVALRGRGGAVSAVAVTSDGSRIVTGSEDGTARVWNASTGEKLFQLEGPRNDPVSSVAVTADGTRIVTGSSYGAQAWDANTGKLLFPLEGHKGRVLALAVTPDGSRIVTGSQDGTVQVRDASTGKPLFTIGDHNSAVRAVAVTPDGNRVVTGSDDGTARVWDAGSGKKLFQLDAPMGQVWGVTVTADGKRIVTGSSGGIVRVWNASTGEKLFELQGHPKDPASSVAVTADGSRIVTGSSDGIARVWDAGTGKLLFWLEGPNDALRAVAVTPDGSRIVTGAEDGTARVWEGRINAPRFQLGDHNTWLTAVAVTPDGSRIVTGSQDRTAWVWNASTGRKLFQLKGHTGRVWAVAVTPDGSRIVTGSEDRTARVWDASTGEKLFQLQGHKGKVWAVAVTPDGSRIVTGSGDGTARVWDASTGNLLFSLEGHKSWVRAVAITPDGRRIVTGSDDRTARVRDASTGKQLFQLQGHKGPVLALAVTSDGSRIVTGSGDGTARVWDASAGKLLFQLEADMGYVRTVAAAPDGNRIVTGSDDDTARVWDASTGKQLFQIEPHTGHVLAVAVTPDGSRIVTVSRLAAHVWALAQLRPLRAQYQFSTDQARQDVIEQGKLAAPRCLSPDERMKFDLPPKPPDWCFRMHKYPYDTEQWQAWKIGKKDLHDPVTSELFGNYADKLLKIGNFQLAFDATELGLQFDPRTSWIFVNQAHALMFLGETQKAREIYLTHQNEILKIGKGDSVPWKQAVVEDFQRLRAQGLEKPLMTEIEAQFKPSLPPREAR